jgi:hypothetical protein
MKKLRFTIFVVRWRYPGSINPALLGVRSWEGSFSAIPAVRTLAWRLA